MDDIERLRAEVAEAEQKLRFMHRKLEIDARWPSASDLHARNAKHLKLLEEDLRVAQERLAAAILRGS